MLESVCQAAPSGVARGRWMPGSCRGPNAHCGTLKTLGNGQMEIRTFGIFALAWMALVNVAGGAPDDSDADVRQEKLAEMDKGQPIDSGFVILAGTVILAMSVVVWLLSTFPSDNVEDSALGAIGRVLEPLGGLLGLDWQMMTALLSSFVAKENTIATLGVILGTGEGEVALRDQIAEVMVPAAAVAFIALQMLFVPCVASLAAIRQETRSWRWTWVALGYTLVISFAVGIVIYQMARLTGWGV